MIYIINTIGYLYKVIRSPKPSLKAKQSQLYQPVLVCESLYHLQDEDDKFF